MSDFLEDVDFPGDSLDIALVLDAVFLEDFDGDFLSRDGVRADPHLSECA